MSCWDRRYRSVVVWAPHPSGKGRGGQGDSPPAERNFICFEPMAGIGQRLNLAHRGQYARAAVDSAGRHVARELLGQAERVLTDAGAAPALNLTT